MAKARGAEPEFEALGKDSDYLEQLARVLENLTGFDVLANELVQNADDAGAEVLVFDVTANALVVDNDASFSDCGRQQDKECPWREERGFPCDFHAFRRLSAASKRAKPGTTGAFGIGFTAVYQVTDRPELLSAGQHIVIDEMLDMRDRARRCLRKGCDRPHSRSGTRFILPWARDPDSELRKALRAPAFKSGDEKELTAALKEALPRALLFVRNLETVEIRKAGKLVERLGRRVEGDTLTVGAPDSEQSWLVLSSSFDEPAKALREENPRQIDARTSTVRIAIPLDGDDTCRFYATLPTADETGLPFHVNAEFFPADDRRSLLWSAHPQADWNRMAVEAAAEALTSRLKDVRNELGPQAFWRMLAKLRRPAPAQPGHTRDAALAAIWERVQPILKRAEIVWTVGRAWVLPATARQMRPNPIKGLPGLLAELNVPAVHPQIAPECRELGQALGVPRLSLEDLLAALEPVTTEDIVEGSELSPPFDRGAARALLMAELAAMVEALDDASDPRLKRIALAPTRSGRVGPLGRLRRADDTSVRLFQRLGLGVEFLDERSVPKSARRLSELAEPVDCRVAVALIDAAVANGWDVPSNRKHSSTLDELIRWLADRKTEVEASLQLRNEIRRLPIWPTADGRRSLEGLTLPGGRQDRLPLSESLEATKLEDVRGFLARTLGVQTLDVETYCSTVLPARYPGNEVTVHQRRQVVESLGRMKGELLDKPETAAALRGLKLVECTDGEWRRVDEAYLRAPQLDALLGPGYPAAVFRGAKGTVVADLLGWLGLTRDPREQDLLRRIDEITKSAPKEKARTQMHLLLDHLASRADRWTEELLASLRERRWLTASSDDEWRAPGELYQRDQMALFASQALFLDVPKQREKTDFLKLLGIETQPPVQLVVDHLAEAASRGKTVVWRVYEYIDSHLEDADLGPLFDSPCILIDDQGAYATPDEVFWKHPFPSRRHLLPRELSRYPDLLDAVGVQREPSCSQALKLIHEIGASEKPTEEDHRTLTECWRLIQVGLDNGLDPDAVRGLADEPVVLDRDGALRTPTSVFFEDAPAIAWRLGNRVASRLINRSEDTWRGLAAAGVLPLSEAARASIVGLGEELDGAAIRRRLLERALLIARVLDNILPGSASGLAQALESLTVDCSTKLTVRYEIEGDDLDDSLYELRALYLANEETLCVVLADGAVPWSDVAQEIARALAPDVQPSWIAGNLKATLEPADRGWAEAELDNLGVPRLEQADEMSDWVEVQEPEDLPSEDEAVEDEAFEWDEAEPGPEEVPVSTAFATDDQPSGNGAFGGAAEASELEERAPESQAGAGGTRHINGDHWAVDSERTTDGGGLNPRAPREPGAPLAGLHLKTFVATAPKRPSGTARPEELDSMAIDRAGMRAAMDVERAAGRDPQRKAQNHKGFDIESLLDGATDRIIEVKSLDGDWDDAHARLSSAQFDVARELGDLYWLYVVEQARSLNPTVWRIQDPARLVDLYAYIPEWKRLAEAD